jgi:hypothetical protein
MIPQAARFIKYPCGEVFDMHGPEAVLMHVPHTFIAVDGNEK